MTGWKDLLNWLWKRPSPTPGAPVTPTAVLPVGSIIALDATARVRAIDASDHVVATDATARIRAVLN